MAIFNLENLFKNKKKPKDFFKELFLRGGEKLQQIKAPEIEKANVELAENLQKPSGNKFLDLFTN